MSQRLECSRRAKRARIGNAHYGDQDHGVEDRGKCFDAGQFDGNHKGRMSALCARALVQRTVGWDDEADNEEIDNVEDANPPDDLPRGSGDFFPGVFGLGCSQSSKLGSAKGEGGRDKNSAESMEAIKEGMVWMMPKTCPTWSALCRRNTVSLSLPIFGTDVPSVIGWDATAVDDNSQDHESNAGEDFHYAESKFDLPGLVVNTCCA